MNKYVIVIIFILSSVAGIYYILPQLKTNDLLREQNEASRKELVKNQAEFVKKQNMIQDLHDKPSAVDRVAREKFGMCRPGERVYKFIDEDDIKKQVSQ